MGEHKQVNRCENCHQPYTERVTLQDCTSELKSTVLGNMKVRWEALQKQCGRCYYPIPLTPKEERENRRRYLKAMKKQMKE